MFSKKKNEQQLSEIATIIGERTVIEGKVNLNSSIRIDGKIYGEIHCDGDVTVGKSGYVEDKIHARNLIVAGTVKADVDIDEKLHILESGYFEGFASMNCFIVDENGRFHGTSEMKNITEKQSVVNMETEVQEKTS